MTYSDMLQQGSAYNQQNYNPQTSNPQTMGQFGPWLHAAFGQQYGQFGNPSSLGAGGYNAGWGNQPQWNGQAQGWGHSQRQLSQQDVSEVVRQLLPALPQILAQAQPPYPALASGAYGATPRTLTPQDVSDVVRQLLPLVPQIAGALQGQQQPQHLGMFGGAAGSGQNNNPFAALQQNPFQQQPFQQQPFQQQPWQGQYGAPQFQSAFGGPQQWGQPQRQLSQHDVAEVTRQLASLIPQVIGSLQTFNQQRMI